MNTRTWIALGSNVGDRLGHLRFAVRALAQLGTVGATSQVYETAPMYVADQPVFLNAVVELDTQLTPLQVLEGLHAIERKRGRKRDEAVRFGPRTLDLDLLLYGQATIDIEGLCVPHPRLLERGFVLVPLAEIAPDLVHPTAHVRIADALASLGAEDIVPLRGARLGESTTKRRASEGRVA